MPPQRPGSAVSRVSGGSPARRPVKPLIDIGQLVGENSTPPPRTSEPSSDPSPPPSQTGSPTARPRTTSLGIGERLSAFANGFSGLQPSRPKSPESSSESKDEAFTPPEVVEKPLPSQSPIPSPLPSPLPPAKPVSPALKSKASKPSSALRFRSSGTPKLNTSSLNVDSAIPPPPSSSTSSDAPIPHITPTPIRSRQEPPAFAVTSRPISYASNLSIGTLAALDASVAAADHKSEPRDAAPATADRPKQDQQQRRPPQEESRSTTVRVVRSVVPLKSSGDEPLPLSRPHARPRLPAIGVTVSNVHLTPPSSSVLTSSSAHHQVSASGAVAPPRKPFALRDSSPASSAGDSSSSRMPATPRDGSDLGVGPPVRHRKRVSVTFVDEIEDERGGRERDRDRRVSVSSRPGHGHGPAVVTSQSDDEDTARDRERDAEEKRKERRRGEAKAAIEVRLLQLIISHVMAN